MALASLLNVPLKEKAVEFFLFFRFLKSNDVSLACYFPFSAAPSSPPKEGKKISPRITRNSSRTISCVLSAIKRRTGNGGL